MSKSIALVDEFGDVVEAPGRTRRSSSFSLTGVPRAEKTITGNYHGIIVDVIGWPDGLRHLHGRRAGDTIEELRAAVSVLGTDETGDYWKPASGNVGAALVDLVDWAQQHPDATWRVL